MTVTAANPSSPPQASDLPPEISAFLDAYRRAIEVTRAGFPV
jgi:hypothetical protein